MGRVLIVYASMTGTTEGIAHILAGYLEELKLEVRVSECTELYPTDYLNFDICVMATYTYGSDGSLPEEAEDFFYELGGLDLPGRIFGVLGSGDLIYDKFCPSVDDFDKQFETTGAIRGAEPLKINLDPNEKDRENIRLFAESLLKKYNESN